jgi:hypothetical protein
MEDEILSSTPLPPPAETVIPGLDYRTGLVEPGCFGVRCCFASVQFNRILLLANINLPGQAYHVTTARPEITGNQVGEYHFRHGLHEEITTIPWTARSFDISPLCHVTSGVRC